MMRETASTTSKDTIRGHHVFKNACANKMYLKTGKAYALNKKCMLNSEVR